MTTWEAAAAQLSTVEQVRESVAQIGVLTCNQVAPHKNRRRRDK